MTNGSESGNNPARRYAGDGWRVAGTAAAARAATTPAAGYRSAGRAHNFSNPLAFSGLLTNRLLTALPGEDFARLLPHLEPVTLARGSNLYELGGSVSHVYFPENAVVSQLHILEDGSTTEAAIIGREGMTGLSAVFGSPAPAHWTQVTIAGSALRVDAELLRQEFACGGAVQRVLLAYASARMACLARKAVCNGRHTVVERLCCWLLTVHDRAGDNRLTLTHEQIANHLGTRRAGISEAAGNLRERGVISYARGQVRIANRRALEEAACECYRTLNRLSLQSAGQV